MHEKLVALISCHTICVRCSLQNVDIKPIPKRKSLLVSLAVDISLHSPVLKSNTVSNNDNSAPATAAVGKVGGGGGGGGNSSVLHTSGKYAAPQVEGALSHDKEVYRHAAMEGSEGVEASGVYEEGVQQQTMER